MPGRLPIEERRARGRRPGVDSGGRPLPEEGTLVALPGADGVPPAPECLLEAGQARWRQVWGHASWLSPAADQPLVARLCEFEDLIEALRQQINADGAMVPGSTGQQRLHPAWSEVRAVVKQALEIEKALGLTPVARSALGVAEVQRPKELSPLERVIAQHAQQRAAGE